MTFFVAIPIAPSVAIPVSLPVVVLIALLVVLATTVILFAVDRVSTTMRYALIRILIAMVSKTNAYRINTCHSVELTVCSAVRLSLLLMLMHMNCYSTCRLLASRSFHVHKQRRLNLVSTFKLRYSLLSEWQYFTIIKYGK